MTVKLKNNVDFKKLENYGYVLSMYTGAAYIKELGLEFENDIIVVNLKDREFFLDTYEYNDKYLLFVIQDLINANLVDIID